LKDGTTREFQFFSPLWNDKIILRYPDEAEALGVDGFDVTYPKPSEFVEYLVNGSVMPLSESYGNPFLDQMFVDDFAEEMKKLSAPKLSKVAETLEQDATEPVRRYVCTAMIAPLRERNIGGSIKLILKLMGLSALCAFFPLIFLPPLFAKFLPSNFAIAAGVAVGVILGVSAAVLFEKDELWVRSRLKRTLGRLLAEPI
jgi:hypothetical protein